MKDNMVAILASFGILAVMVFWSVGSSAVPMPRQDEFRKLSGPYLGQTPPGDAPELFAPGIISTSGSQGCCVFFDGGTKLVFKRWSPARGLWFTWLDGEHWVEPVEPAFAGSDLDSDFTMSPAGKRMFLTSDRGVKVAGGQRAEGNIWYSDFDGVNWSEAVRLGEPVCYDANHESYPTVAADGTLYFFARGRGGPGESDIFVSHLVDGEYTEPECLPESINTPYHEWDPVIAPDQSYLLFCSKKPGLGEDDLYISVRAGDGSWMPAVMLDAPVNSPSSENRPFITADGKYLFFASDRPVDETQFSHLSSSARPGNGQRHVYWVDARVVTGLVERSK